METESPPKNKHKNHKRKKHRKPATELTDQELLKKVEQKDPVAYSELCQLVLKEGLTKIIKAVKSNSKSSKALNESKSHTTSPVPIDHFQQPSLRPLKLPKLRTKEDLPIKNISNEIVPKIFNSQKSLNSLTQSRTSPYLNPIKTLTNSVFRAGYKSRVGTINGKPKLHNEDTVIIKANLQNLRGQYLFAICDGHGREGYEISEFVKENYPIHVEMLFPPEPRPEKIQKSLIVATENLSNSLANSKIDSIFSGCTLVTVVISGQNLICSNLGNCKAILGHEGNKWQMIPLTTEHTLDNKVERDRMIDKNARIELEIDKSCYSPIHIQKAYMGTQNVPGLEITRSLGDKCGKYIGMISSPDTITYFLNPEDKFLIIGSSGFWKFVSEIEAYMIVRHSWEKNQIEESCEDLLRHANMKWKENCRDKDDISIIVVYLGGHN